MIKNSLILKIFQAASIQRWNDYPRMIDLVELDKQAHKFIITYFIAKLEKDINYKNLIEAGIFEFLRRVVVTDIRPDVFHKVLKQKAEELNNWVIEKLSDEIKDIEQGEFLKKFKNYLNDENMYKKERFVLKAASYLATKWEFDIVYQTSSFLSDIDEVKKEVELEIEDYYELIAVQKIVLNKKLAKIIDLSGRLRFQKRWAQTPRVPETSVLGHMLIVAIFSYFYSIKIKANSKRLENSFFTALFHDLPEALTRDIISPVKYSVDELADIIASYEIQKINEQILPNIPQSIKKEFSYILGINKDGKDEFQNRIIDKYGEIQEIKEPQEYDKERFSTIDGEALKQCDSLSAYIEASLSISHGIKSFELISGKKEILKKLKEINGFDFKQIALNIDKL
ncbi:MAG: hydrolase [Campylobacteraceae bacterium 4484_166]|nr:MAG: hydrolase [Campylobacteraceae bacterium 4484_166]